MEYLHLPGFTETEPDNYQKKTFFPGNILRGVNLPEVVNLVEVG
jgi:hypothetical protein